MPAYVIITREKTRNAAELEQYKQLTPASFKEHPPMVQAIQGRMEVLEGSAAEDVILLEFSTYEKAKAWYHGSAYQEASKHRHQGGDYRFIVTEGNAAQ
ncbi:MAG TPA: DUF1330 domain-containing protein [Terracidiphilus sp.]|nr:DUF1330 domain-containing protein [Terracidiphilus sp.]